MHLTILWNHPRNSKLQIYKIPLESHAEGTSLFTSLFALSHLATDLVRNQLQNTKQWSGQVCSLTHIPTIVLEYELKPRLVGTIVWILEHVIVIAFMLDIIVLRNQMHIVDPNVNTKTRIPVPVKVRSLGHVCHIVSRFQITCVVQVLEKHVSWRRDVQTYSNRKENEI